MLRVRGIPSSNSTRYLLLQNRQGKARLSKWSVHDEDNEKHQVDFFLVAIKVRPALRPRPCLFSS
jgi:hypothetical protein